MEFDQLCKEVERRFPQHRKMLEDARLFVIEPNDVSVPGSSNKLNDWQPEEKLVENFRLPFNCIAVNFGMSCVVIRELVADKREYEMIGLVIRKSAANFFHAKIRAFPGGFSLDQSRLGKVLICDDLEIFKNGKEIDFSMSDVSLSRADRLQFSKRHVVNLDQTDVPAQKMMVANRLFDLGDPFQQKELIPLLDQNIGEIEWAMGGLTANMVYLVMHEALVHLLVICEPGRFIVEQSVMGQKEPKGKLIKRSKYRKHYIPLHPLEIKKRYLYDENDPTGIVVTPHERRGHWRTYHSEKFVHKRGEKVWIKAMWVGKTEGVRGKNMYKVRLDL